jgi:hypothetical protein
MQIGGVSQSGDVSVYLDGYGVAEEGSEAHLSCLDTTNNPVQRHI